MSSPATAWVRADDDLGSTLANLHDIQSASLLAGSLVDQSGIAELEAQASSAAVNGLALLLATDGSGHSGELVVASSGVGGGLLDIHILATRGHEVEFGDGEAEHMNKTSEKLNIIPLFSPISSSTQKAR